MRFKAKKCFDGVGSIRHPALATKGTNARHRGVQQLPGEPAQGRLNLCGAYVTLGGSR